MMTVWGRLSSINVQKVVWTLLHLSIDHERIDAGGPHGGLDTDAFGALYPNRRIPVLADGETVLFESNAIVRYLTARYDAGGLWPEDPVVRARSDMWMDWASTALGPSLTTLLFQLVRTPEEKRDAAAIKAATTEVNRLFGIVDDWLATSAYLVGDQLTIGDIPVGASTYRYFALPIERPDLRNLETYYARLQEHPAYRDGVMIPLQ